jgi:hypothetical protein
MAPPDAPANLTAGSVGRGTVKLGWADRSNNEQHFCVERSDSASGGFVQIATVGAGVRNYEDKAVSGGRTYYYRVRASNGGGNSAYSNTASARPR